MIVFHVPFSIGCSIVLFYLFVFPRILIDIPFLLLHNCRFVGVLYFLFISCKDGEVKDTSSYEQNFVFSFLFTLPSTCLFEVL